MVPVRKVDVAVDDVDPRRSARNLENLAVATQGAHSSGCEGGKPDDKAAGEIESVHEGIDPLNRNHRRVGMRVVAMSDDREREVRVSVDGL